MVAGYPAGHVPRDGTQTAASVEGKPPPAPAVWAGDSLRPGRLDTAPAYPATPPAAPSEVSRNPPGRQAGGTASPSRPPTARWIRHRWGECSWRSTNRGTAGLRSIARNNKATRLLTRPGCAAKSSAKGSSPREVKLQSAGWARPPRGRAHRRPAGVRGQRPIRTRLRRAGEDRPVLAWILT
jgi:hypothetical protein